MDAKGIVISLRACATEHEAVNSLHYAKMLTDAASLIESLTDQLTDKTALLEAAIAGQEKGCEWCKALSFNPDIGGCQLVFFKSKKHPKGEHAISVSVFDEYGEEQEPVLVQIDNCIRCGKRLEVEHGE